jgi:hypothetical protein
MPHAKRSQTSTELIIVLGFLTILLLLILSATFDIPSVFQNSEKIRSQTYWSQAPVGVIALQSTMINTTLVIQNNFRQDITLDAVTLDGVEYVFSNMTAEYTSSGDRGAYYRNIVINNSWVLVSFTVSFSSGAKYVFNGTQSFPMN